jgi:hypothetical protein
MGFLSKKNLLVSLLALSLAACTTPTPRKIKDTTTVDLPCSGDPLPQDVAKTIKFEITNSACTLDDVDFIKDPHGNSGHFTKTKKATSADPTVVFTYNGPQPPLPGDGAYFYYNFHTPKAAGGGGGGIIK